MFGFLEDGLFAASAVSCVVASVGGIDVGVVGSGCRAVGASASVVEGESYRETAIEAKWLKGVEIFHPAFFEGSGEEGEVL
jgi:hypothetical protein